MRNRPPARLAVLAALCAALAVSGCGRKGGLEKPPEASLTEPAGAAPAAQTADGRPARTADGRPVLGPDGKPVKPKQRFFLDFLID